VTLKTYLFSYRYDGSEYGLQIKAYSQEEAVGRVRRMSTAIYDGEIMVTIPLDASSIWQKIRSVFA
jgi:hypothetical protein